MSAPLAAPSLSRRSIAARLFVSPTRHLAAPSPRFLDSRLLLYGLRCSATVCTAACAVSDAVSPAALCLAKTAWSPFPVRSLGVCPGVLRIPLRYLLPPSSSSSSLFFFFFLPENWLGKAVVRPIIFCSCHRIRVLIHPVVPSVPRR